MALTYDAIASTTLGSATNVVTFSNISQSYTDLRIVASVFSDTNSTFMYMRANGITGGVYSQGTQVGDGSVATSTNYSNAPYVYLDSWGTMQMANSASIPITFVVDWLGYSGSSIYISKCGLYYGFANKGSTGGTSNGVFTLRTFDPISSLTFQINNGNFRAGSKWTLFGIKAA